MAGQMDGNEIAGTTEMSFERYLFLEKEQGVCQIREILNREGAQVHRGRLWKN